MVGVGHQVSGDVGGDLLAHPRIVRGEGLRGAAGGEYGHGQLAVGRDVGAVDLGVMVELAVDLTQRPHRARRFEGAA